MAVRLMYNIWAGMANHPPIMAANPATAQINAVLGNATVNNNALIGGNDNGTPDFAFQKR